MREVTLQIFLILQQEFKGIELSDSCLVSADILTIGELVQKSRESLREIEFLWESTEQEIENALKRHGLELKEEEPVKFTSECEY